MATISIVRNKTLPNSSDKSDFHDLVDTATATISGIEQSDLGAGIGTVVRQATAPSDNDQIWVDTSVTPYVVRIHDGTEWIATGGYAVLTNKSGAQRVLGDVCVVDTANAGAFTTTTLYGDPRQAVVVMETIDDSSDGVVAISGGRVTNVKIDGAINPGDFFSTASTATKAAKGFHNTFGTALATLTGTGTLSEALFSSKSFIGTVNASIPVGGTSGQFWKTLGAGANPLWADVVDKAGTAISSLIIKAIYFSDTTTVNKTIGGSHTVAKNATGDYTITWAGTAFADANYIVVGSGNRIAGNQIITIGISTRTTTTTRVYGVNGGSGDTNITDGFLIAIGT